MLGPVYTELTGNIDLLKQDDTTVMLAIIFYTFWTGFGTNILLMSGAMSAIDDSVVEACYLDGCNMTKEFIYVTLPSVYPTITTFIVLDLTGLFSNSMHLYTFYGQDAPIKSVGYFMEINLLKSPGLYNQKLLTNPGIYDKPGFDVWLTYPHLAAMGLMITLVVSPIAIYMRKLLEKIGPSED
jgi:ABC-type sugar transport system permease subunit